MGFIVLLTFTIVEHDTILRVTTTLNKYLGVGEAVTTTEINR